MRQPDINFDLREMREDRAERHGHTRDQARTLRRQAAQSACCCGECFRPLAPMDSVTMQGRDVGWRKNPSRVRVPVCLLCTLDGIRNNWRGRDVYYETPRWHRARCLNCTRPIRIYGDSANAQTCCADCQRAMRNARNKLRRRVQHEPMACIECGRSFLPKRADALTCSTRCRVARHRRA